MNGKMLVFIGGKADGLRRMVEDGRYTLEFASMKPLHNP